MPGSESAGPANAVGRGREEALAIHPTVKPVSMVADAMLDASSPGEVVLDGFINAGSTLHAAERTGRCLGVFSLSVTARRTGVRLGLSGNVFELTARKGKVWVNLGGDAGSHQTRQRCDESGAEWSRPVGAKIP